VAVGACSAIAVQAYQLAVVKVRFASTDRSVGGRIRCGRAAVGVEDDSGCDRRCDGVVRAATGGDGKAAEHYER
jgi:hypothetical protein